VSIGQDSFLSSLPSDWTFDRFKDVALLRNERTDEASEVEDYLELEDLESGTGRILNRRNTMEVVSDVTMFKKGDVLFGKLRPYLEKYYVAEFDGKCTGEILAFKPVHIESRFLFYCLASSWFIERCNLLAYGAKMPRVNWPTQLAQFNLPLPPLPEQQRIAAYLDASCAAIDAAVAAKRRQLDTLDALRKSIIQGAVTRGISTGVALESTGNTWMEHIPRGWTLVCLKRIAEIQGGLTLGKQYEGPLVERPYLRVGNVQDGHLDLADVSVIELPASVAATVELRPDDVLMTEGGDLDKLGRGTLWKGEIPGCLHQNHIFAVRCFLHKLKPMFLAYVTAAKYGRDYFEATGKKTTNLACTNATKVGQFPIPLPPLGEQEAICAHLDEKLAELKRIVAGIDAQIATLTAYRKSLIHECVTGQRRITAAEVRHTTSRTAKLTCPGQREGLHA
jgi:type I restriction enzyme S subunit